MKAGILLPQAGDYATRENILYVAKEAERKALILFGYLNAFCGL
jgi:hypothetical protein